MALSPHLFIKANGEKIVGETKHAYGTENMDGSGDPGIECFSFDYGVDSATERHSGTPSGQRSYEPIRIVKRVNKSSPRIWQALTDNQEIEAVFKFHRPDTTGEQEHFYTVEIKQARVQSIELSVPDTLMQSTEPPTEVVTFNYNVMVQTYEPDGVAHEDTRSAGAS